MRKIKTDTICILIGCLIFIITGISFSFLSDLIQLKLIGFIMAITFGLFAIIHLYKVLFRETDIIYKLEQADKKNLFSEEIRKIKQYRDSLELHKSQFLSYDGTVNRMTETYQMIYNRIYADIDAIFDHISRYDYITKPSRKPINQRLGEIHMLIQKLNELNTLYIELDNSTTNESDIQRVDDLLSALKEILHEN